MIFHGEGLSFDADSADEAALQIVKEMIERDDPMGAVFCVTDEKDKEFFFSTETVVKKLDEVPGPRLVKNDATKKDKKRN